MTLLFVEPWLSYPNNQDGLNQNGWVLEGTSTATMVIASATPRISGSKYLHVTSSASDSIANKLGISFTDKQTVFFNSSFNFFEEERSGICYFFDTAVQHISVLLNTDAKIYVYRGTDSGTLIATSTLLTSYNAWHHVEIKVKIDNTVGIVIVNIDGIEFINFSGDTQNAGNATCNKISLGNAYLQAANAYPGTNKLMGEIFIFDDQGSFWNDFQGDIACVAMPPTSDVTPNQFTPSAGTDHFAMVDEVVPDEDTTYLESSTDAQQCLFAPDALAANISELLGVVLENVSRKTDIDDNQISNFLKVSTTSTVSTPTGLTTDYTYSRNIYESNPDTAVAWALADWTNISFGFENTVP